MSSSPELDALASTARHLLAAKYFQVAAFVMLLYDHMLTFDQEVNRIWKQKFSGVTLLFLTNRYLTPIQFTIIMVAFHYPSWTGKVCEKYVVFEGASSATLIAVCQLIMIIRVYALYHRSLAIIIFLMILWATQIIVSAIGVHTGYRVPLPPMLRGCILIGDSPVFSLLWVGPLVTDTCIFALTLWRTRMYIIDTVGRGPTMGIFIRDGIFYFLVIFLVNLMNTLLFFLAPVDLHALGAPFGQLLTNVMVSRLVLNLRYSSEPPEHDPRVSGFNMQKRIADQPFMIRTIGNLGEDLIFSGSSTEDRREENLEVPLVNISTFSRNI